MKIIKLYSEIKILTEYIDEWYLTVCAYFPNNPWFTGWRTCILWTFDIASKVKDNHANIIKALSSEKVKFLHNSVKEILGFLWGYFVGGLFLFLLTCWTKEYIHSGFCSGLGIWEYWVY